ncbi:MAG: hypothetical protein GX087_04590 [Desulfobulbaceae bacterium]|nr:hypothetical protein [Desulfobulbaceae bacterium]
MRTQPVIRYDAAPYQRILVIADIHGGYQAFIALLREVQPGRDDLLVTLGDYIDRGPDSREVIAKLRSCAAELNSVHLRGNHEAMLLMALSRSPAIPDMYDKTVPDDSASLADNCNMWLNNGGLATLESYCRTAGAAAQKSLAALRKTLVKVNWLEADRISTENALVQHCTELSTIVPPEDFSFMRATCADLLVTRQHLLTHGGYDAHSTPKAQNLSTLHWGYPGKACTSLSKTLVVGHQITRERLPKLIGSLLYLDTGSSCVADGRLTCMNILNQEFWQADQNGRICYHGRLA